MTTEIDLEGQVLSLAKVIGLPATKATLEDARLRLDQIEHRCIRSAHGKWIASLETAVAVLQGKESA